MLRARARLALAASLREGDVYAYTSLTHNTRVCIQYKSRSMGFARETENCCRATCLMTIKATDLTYLRQYFLRPTLKGNP